MIDFLDVYHPRVILAPKFVILAPSNPLIFLALSSLVSPSSPLPAARYLLPPSCPKLKHTFFKFERPEVAKAYTFAKSERPGLAKAETCIK